MRNKVIILLLLLLVVGGVSSLYFYKKADTTAVSELPTGIDLTKNSVDVNEVVESQSSSTDIIVPVENMFIDSRTRLGKNRSCGNTIDSINAKKQLLANQGIELKKSQELALSKLIENCLEWYVFYENMDDDLKQLDEQYKKEKSEYGPKYVGASEYDEAKIDVAMNHLHENIDDMDYIVFSLSYLLRNDPNLIKKLSEELGTTDISIITMNSFEIAGLFFCRVNQSQCSPESDFMLQLCLGNEDRCGQRYENIIMSTRTINQFADLNYIIDIILKLHKQKYFEKKPL